MKKYEMMSRVYIGSTNRVKIDAVNQVLIDYDIIGVEVDSGVGPQPKSDEETILGAYNRAKSLPKGNLRIGLEAGIEKHDGKIFLINWGVLIDENDNVYYGGGTRLPLPQEIGERLYHEEVELATLIDEHYHREDIKHQEGAVGILTNNYVRRIDIFIHIVRIIYGQYLHNRGVI